MSDCGMSREAVKAEAEKFRDYWTSVAGAKGRKTDWHATWRNWCRNARPAISRNGQPSISTEERDRKALEMLFGNDNVIEGEAHAQG